jgi:hypothetical protein
MNSVAEPRRAAGTKPLKSDLGRGRYPPWGGESGLPLDPPFKGSGAGEVFKPFVALARFKAQASFDLDQRQLPH